ncbi:MAG: hypothetical protein AAFR33_01720 [Pseudomonadota bacterium]
MTALVRTTDTAPAAPRGVVARDAKAKFLSFGTSIPKAANDGAEGTTRPSLLVSRRTRQRRRMARS